MIAYRPVFEVFLANASRVLQPFLFYIQKIAELRSLSCLGITTSRCTNI